MKVLIVDDDVVARMVLMDLVDGALGAAGTAEGVELLEAEDGEDAWRQLDAGLRPALLFCDLRMPRLSGMELLARVKADTRFSNMRFVLASAAGDAATMQQAMGLGADGYVVKPFDEAKVRTHLAHLAGLAAPGASQHDESGRDETPAAAAQRLGIDRERMLAYLGGLRRQLDEAAPQIAGELAAGEVGAVQARLARLAEGCRTLGMVSAAAALDAQRLQPDAAGVERALETAVARALCRIGTLHGPGN